MSRAWHLLAMLALGACQPLPHPFAADRPPAAMLTLRDIKGVSVGPIDGTPTATATRLREAVAKALQIHDIPASGSTASQTSYQLGGRIEESPAAQGKSRVTVFWRLRDAGGKLIGERKQGYEAASAEWQSGADKPVEELAEASAEMLAPLLSDEPTGHTVAELLNTGRMRVSIGAVGGAPGDGDHSLAAAVATVLKRQDLDILTDPRDPADLKLEGRVSVTPLDPGKQHVKIVWSLRRADGSQVGTVGQENDVPKGSLDAAWGDIAYSIAVAAQSGILELVARAGPPPAGKS